jgi:hypothetical protein|eukprot:SAG25_NODE_580_length_6767_cov_20.692412_4_plen_149_part_00
MAQLLEAAALRASLSELRLGGGVALGEHGKSVLAAAIEQRDSLRSLTLLEVDLGKLQAVVFGAEVCRGLDLSESGLSNGDAILVGAVLGSGELCQGVQSLHVHGNSAIGDSGKFALAAGESKRLVVESPWSQLTSECQRFGHPPRLDK